MFLLLLRHSLRYWNRHRFLTLLNLLGIGLGVAVFLSIQIVNRSALHAFQASVDLVAGKASLELHGDGVPFDESVLPLVRQMPGIRASTPIVEEVCLFDDFPGEYLHLVGVDIFSNAPFRTFELKGASGQAIDGYEFITEPNVLAITRSLAERLGIHAGDNIRLRSREGVRLFKAAFLLEFTDEAVGADEHIAVMDIAHVQENFGQVGKLSRIDVLLNPGNNLHEAEKTLRQKLPSSILIQTPDRRGEPIEKMLGAFQLNLTALSLIALLVGLFLIYNTVSAAVIRRRMEIGLLRSLGATPPQIQRLLLAESLLLGLLGGAFGVGIGLLLAQQMIGIASRSITSLYLLVHIGDLALTPDLLLAAFGITWGGVLLAAWIPSREASRIPVVEALQPGFLSDASALTTGRWLCVGIGFFILSATFAQASFHWPILSFVSALTLLLGSAFCVPALSKVFVTRVSLTSFSGQFILRSFLRSLHRNSVTIAALVTALAMTIGLAVMVHSFRKTVEVWLDQSVKADLFISSTANLVVGHKEVLRPEVETEISKIPEIAAWDSYRELKITYANRPVKLASIRFPVAAQYNRLVFLEGTGNEILTKAAGTDSVCVSEAFSRKFKAPVGSTVPLITPSGEKSFRVAGVFYDYTTEFGLILMDRMTYQRHWKDPFDNSLALYAKPGVPVETLQKAIRERLTPLGSYLIFSNRELRNQVFRIFDQTFALTEVLRTVALLVSALAVALGQIILTAERQREIALLQAAGAQRTQIHRLLAGEAGLIGIIASLIGLPIGLLLAAILCFVINIVYFGWTIRWDLPWDLLLSLPPAVIVVAILSALIPARRVTRESIAERMKME